MAVDKEKFSGVWNAERVLNVYLILANNKGNKEDLAIRYSQLQSVIKAFSSLVGDPEADVSAVEIDFAGGLYLDPLMTGEQCLKFRRLVQRNILDTSPYFQYQMKDLGKYLASHYFRTNIFKILIRYRSAAQRLLDQTFKTCEYDSEFAQAIGIIQQLYESNIHGANTILEQLICYSSAWMHWISILKIFVLK